MGRIDFTLNKAIKTAIFLLLFVDLIAMCIAGYIYIGFFLQKKIKDTEEEKVTSEPTCSDNKKEQNN